MEPLLSWENRREEAQMLRVRMKGTSNVSEI
jgi:hypothetical protein